MTISRGWALVATLLCVPGVVCRCPASADRIECHREMDITGLPKGTTGYFGRADTKLTTYKGAIYCAYLDVERFVRIRRRGPDGEVTDAKVFGPVAADPYHMPPVIGLDGDGYIHVAAGMHDARQWVYYISEESESIDRFAKQEPGSARCPPGMFITYPEFARDRKGYLYVTSRQGTKNPSFLGGCIARYDHMTRTWTPLGVEMDRWNFIIWHPKDQWYQQWYMRVHFDRANNLHLAWKVNAIGPTPNFGDGSHLMYACLPEGETTWRTVEDAPIAGLPLTTDNASVIATDLENPELVPYGLGVQSDGKPVVNFRYVRGNTPEGRDKGWLSRWTGTRWQRVFFPREVVIPTLLMSDNRGGLFTHSPGGNTGYLSRDSGATWDVITIPYERGYAGYHSLDYQHFIETGEPRIAAFFADDGAIEVWTLRTVEQ